MEFYNSYLREDTWYKMKCKYSLKRCSKTECCKQCRHVKLRGTMTKWPVHRKRQRTTQIHVEHQDATHIKETIFLCFKYIFVTTSLCSHILFGPQGSWSVHVCCLHLKWSSAYALGSVSGVALFITTEEQLQ